MGGECISQTAKVEVCGSVNSAKICSVSGELLGAVALNHAIQTHRVSIWSKPQAYRRYVLKHRVPINTSPIFRYARCIRITAVPG